MEIFGNPQGRFYGSSGRCNLRFLVNLSCFEYSLRSDATEYKHIYWPDKSILLMQIPVSIYGQYDRAIVVRFVRFTDIFTVMYAPSIEFGISCLFSRSAPIGAIPRAASALKTQSYYDEGTRYPKTNYATVCPPQVSRYTLIDPQ